MDKKDLDELDKLEYEREQEQFEKYGMDLRKVNRKAVAKKNEKFVKGLRRIGYIFRNIYIMIAVILVLAVLLYLVTYWSSLYERSNVNVKSQIELQYNIKLKLLSKETSGRAENGKYYFETKNEPHINFMAEKYYGKFTTDYLDKITKYYFELWNSPNKKLFVVNENIENEMLNYELYLDFKKCKDIDEAGEIFIEFVEFCGADYKPYWDVFIKLDEGASDRIYPSVNFREPHEENLDEIRNLYYFHLKFMNKSKDLNITNESN